MLGDGSKPVAIKEKGMPMGLFGSTRVEGRSKHMGHHERRKRKGFLAGKKIEAMYFDEFEAEISKNCATEFDKRLKYVFKVPEILEKAWEMPFREDKETYLRPVVCLAGLENIDECIVRSNDTCMAILEDQGWYLRNKSFEKKDWRDFK